VSGFVTLVTDFAEHGKALQSREAKMSARTMRYSAALTTILFATGAIAQNRYALGPVETSNSKVDVVVLGQRFTLDANTRCIARAKVVSKQLCTLSLSKGVYAVIEGDPLRLARAATITVLPYSYVPGASTVMAGGQVSDVQPEIGNFRVGDLLVSSTQLLAQGAISLRPGEYVEVVGTQPQANDVLLANGLRWNSIPDSDDSSATTVEIVASQTITGTGIQTITGTGIQTITGTGIQTITGTGIQTITGTGTQTITGTGAQTITGTGAQTITGTGKQTITGTGIQTITGTGKQTITGTGTQTITGTGKQTITGTGTRTITGTGR
jgi:hypothetical protein